jgi:hypothetical protein
LQLRADSYAQRQSAGYATKTWKLAGAFALGTSFITAVGLIVSLFAGKLVTWIVSIFR